MTTVKVHRRDFLRVGMTGATGLVLGFTLPERNKLGAVSAAASRKPVFTRAACPFSYQRLHEISSGQIREKSLKEILIVTYRIISEGRAQYGAVSSVRGTRSAEPTPKVFRRTG